jgi:plasmid stability protein
MAQALIRNLDDELLADYRVAAATNRRSLEAELREALRRARPVSPERRAQVLARLAEIRSMTLDLPQTPSEELVRRERDDGH